VATIGVMDFGRQNLKDFVIDYSQARIIFIN